MARLLGCALSTTVRAVSASSLTNTARLRSSVARSHARRRLTAHSGTTRSAVRRDGEPKPKEAYVRRDSPHTGVISAYTAVYVSHAMTDPADALRISGDSLPALSIQYTAATPTSLSSLAPIWAQRPTTSPAPGARGAPSPRASYTSKHVS